MTSTVLLRLAIQRSPLRFQPFTRNLKVFNRLPNSLLCCKSRHLSSKPVPASVKIQPPVPNGREGGPKADFVPVGEITVREQRKKDWSIMRKMIEHMWPRDWGVRSRVVLGLGLLIGGKVNFTLNFDAFSLNVARTLSC